MNFFKNNASLIVAFSLPVVLIVIVAIGVYLPGLFVKPHFDFIYSIGDFNYNSPRFGVENGVVLEHPPVDPNEVKYRPQTTLYYYDVQSETSREITLQQAQNYRLNTANESPDGFSIGRGSYGGDFLFFFDGGRDYNAVYLQGNGVSKKVQLQGDGSYYNFHLLGWVVPQVL